MLRDQPRHGVIRSARRGEHDHVQHLAAIELLDRLRRRRARAACQDGSREAVTDHSTESTHGRVLYAWTVWLIICCRGSARRWCARSIRAAGDRLRRLATAAARLAPARLRDY